MVRMAKKKEVVRVRKKKSKGVTKSKGLIAQLRHPAGGYGNPGLRQRRSGGSSLGAPTRRNNCVLSSVQKSMQQRPE